MATRTFVLSDLHLADSSSVFECFGDRQQQAFAHLLHFISSIHLHNENATDTYASYSTPSTLISQDDNIEIVINGDCFDFLVTTPYDFYGVIDVKTALEKLEKIIAAHNAFFAILHSFLSTPGRMLTFVTGNHDIELCFAEVRERICLELLGVSTDARVRFCPTRFYQPATDVYIEHGNYYDFWNHAIAGLWSEDGQPLTRTPERITLPPGSRYFQHAAHSLSRRYPYFDHLDPSMNITRQTALLCLFAPELVMETTRRMLQLLSHPPVPYASLLPGEEQNPVRVYEETIMAFILFQQDMVAHKTDWSASQEDMQISPAALQEFQHMRETLTLPLPEAVATIFTPVPYTMGEDVVHGMHAVLQQRPEVRYVIAGHTHMQRVDRVDGVDEKGAAMPRRYLNTGSWTTRVALPTPADFEGTQGAALLAWLRDPVWEQPLLHDVTELVFALVISEEGKPSHANLCVWEEGMQGRYRILS